MRLANRFNKSGMISGLVINNNRKEQFRFALLLRRIGFKSVICASTGKKGIILARRFHPDLILIDLLLPDMDGDDVSREIKKNIKVKVIILSDFRHGHFVQIPDADMFIAKKMDLFSFYQTITRLQWGKG